MLDVKKTEQLREAGEALASGEFASARAQFEDVAKQHPNDADAWLGAGFAASALGDLSGALSAANRALQIEPKKLRAHILRGDLLSQAGDMRGAIASYAAALKSAPSADALPHAVAADLARAAAAARSLSEQFRARLLQSGDAAGERSQRFEKSIDLLTGRQQVYLQQPRFYFFPDLPNVQFYDRRQFEWAPGVEAATSAIRAELMNLMKQAQRFSPYVQGVSRGGGDGQGLLNNADWSACYIIKDGAVVEEVASQCPATLAALANVPLARAPGRSPSVLFSLLRPGMHIPPHHGFVNTRLIGHLPLIVPANCALRVGSETRQWVEGELTLFDDTIEHEAWNRSDQVRVVLLFDFWRPELTLAEREMVASMFATLDELGGRGAKWD